MGRMSVARPEPGTEMIFQWRKWNGAPHWRHECIYLGADEWGDWLGQPSGWHSERPGAASDAPCPNVTLVPSSRDFDLTVNRDHPHAMRIYINLGWEVRWSDPLLVTGIDMDLDVIRIEREQQRIMKVRTWVDDHDDWTKHSAEFGYPPEIMKHLETLALDLEARVRARVAPFNDAVPDVWLDRLKELR